MSSLANQLNHIAASSGSVVLDRKRRQTIHSASLIFEPKVAATQDYTEILNHSLDALNDLEKINPVFGKFRSSLFSETSISVDRNVQTKDQIRDLNNAINTFLSLIAPYWSSPLSFNAVEWLVRRFHIQIHNSEAFLLSALPFYNLPIFAKIVSITPKFPPLFSWLIGFKKSGKMLTKDGLIKGGFSDLEFSELYTNYLSDLVSKKFVDPHQLVFFVSCMVGTLSKNSTNEIFLEKLAGNLIKLCVQLLNTDRVETQVAANTILVVLANTILISQDIIDNLVRMILNKPKSQTSAIVAIYKIYETIPIIPNKFPNGFNLLCKMISDNVDVQENFIMLLDSDSSGSYKLLVSIFRKLLLENKFKLFVNWKEYANHAKFNNSTTAVLMNDIITASKLSFDDNSHIVDFIGFFCSSAEHKKLFLDTLKQKNYSIDELEMNLQSVLSCLKVDKIALESDVKETKDPKNIRVEELELVQKFIARTKINEFQSFLLLKKDVDDSFKKLNQHFIMAVNLNLSKKFLDEIFDEKDFLSLTTFLLRASISQNTPTSVRIESVQNLTALVGKVQNQYYLITIFPVVLTLLSDPIKSIRASVLSLLKIFSANSQYLKNNFTLAENMFLKDEIFGIDNSSKVSALNPKDAFKLVNVLISNFESFTVDSTQFFKVFESSVFTLKKIGDITLAYLADNSQIIDLPYVKIALMMLVRIGTKTIKDFTTSSHIYNTFLNEYILKRPFWRNECLEANFDFCYFEKSVLNLLNLEKYSKSENKKNSIITSLSFLQKAINSEYLELVDLSILKLISTFSKLKIDYQTGLAQSIVENSTSSDFAVLYDPLEVLQSLPLSNEIFVKLFKNFQLYNNSVSSNEPSNENVPKRRRRSSTSTRQQMKKTEVTKLAEIHLRNVIILLETFEKVGVDLMPSSELLTGLFKLMSDLETLGEDGNLPVLYAQESLANCLLICIKNAETYKVKLQSNSIRADVLVSIIRSSNSPQLQNRLLLIIAELAILEPEFILHSIMPIFTFMGAFTVKQDDEYSSYVIEQTISKVIPALAASSNQNKLEEVEFLLTSFISAFNHIPRHRRVNLFTTLSQILGSQNSIHIILFLIGKQYSRASIKHKYNECMMLVEFIKSFMKNFEISDQLKSIKNFLDLWSHVPDKAINKKMEETIYNEFSSRPIFGEEIANLNNFEMLLFKKNLISFIDRSIITDSEYNRHSLPYLKLQVAALLLDNRAEKSKIDVLLDVFNQLVTSVLEKLTSSARKVTDENNELFEISKKIDRKFYRLLNDSLSLLPVNYFVEAIKKLFSLPKNEKNIVIISNIIYLASRQFETEPNDSEIAISSANDLFFKLVDIITDYQAKPNAEIHEIIQNSMDTLSSLLDKFREKIDNGYLIRVLNSLTAVNADRLSFINNFEAPELIISSLNLISNIVSVIGIKSIGFFPKIIVPSIMVFEQSLKDSNQNMDTSNDDDDDDEVLSSDQLIQTSVALLYSCFIKKMPQLLSSHLKTILLHLLNQNLIKKEIKLSVLNIAFTNIPLKSLFNVLISIWNSEKFDKKSASTIGLFLNLLTQTVENIDRSTAVRSVNLFTDFLISSFEFVKNNNGDILNRNAISRIESLFFTCELQFVMKLKDAVFRPIFGSAVVWAFEDNELESEADFVRICIFFKFFNKLQDNLKSLITSYYTYVLDYVYQLLEHFVLKKPTTQEYIINAKRLLFISLNNSFKYDAEDYWTIHTRFEKISIGLTNQLSVTENKLGKHLTKTITTMTAKNSKNPEHNMSINKLLIGHLNADCNSQEKFFTIKVFEAIYSKVGTSWMSLLPQLVPVIAELLDDDDEKVELEVRSGLVRVIEDVLGESLEKYLV